MDPPFEQFASCNPYLYICTLFLSAVGVTVFCTGEAEDRLTSNATEDATEAFVRDCDAQAERCE